MLHSQLFKFTCSHGQGCPTVAFNWEIFAKHDHLSLSDISLESFLIQIVFKKH